MSGVKLQVLSCWVKWIRRIRFLKSSDHHSSPEKLRLDRYSKPSSMKALIQALGVNETISAVARVGCCILGCKRIILPHITESAFIPLTFMIPVDCHPSSPTQWQTIRHNLTQQHREITGQIPLRQTGTRSTHGQDFTHKNMLNGGAQGSTVSPALFNLYAGARHAKSTVRH